MKDLIRHFIPQKVINYLKHLPMAYFASLYYGFPAKKLKIVGVTGTEGKTTVVNLIYHILETAGEKNAMISTVCAKIGQEEIDTGLHVTSPSHWPLRRLLKKISDKGIKTVILEVTSNGLDQFRFWGINFEIGLLTNLHRDHLDYHKTFDNYRLAKLKLFKKSKIVILNKDDSSYDFLAKRLKDKTIITYGLKNQADFIPVTFNFQTTLMGDYNQLNCLAAIAACSVLGVDGQVIRKGLLTFKGVEGRLQEIKEGQNFQVFVDFAHSPVALEVVLKALKLSMAKTGKLMVVFGSAGKRDQGKRPLMGEAAACYADQIVLTADDPRDEKVAEICKEIAEGIGQKKPYKVIEDRSEAIAFALKEARKGDIVALCGKGHEKSLAIGDQEIPWSDQEEARKILKNLKRRS